MNGTNPLLLVGVGTSGARMVRGVLRAFGEPLRHVTLDTDASSAEISDESFILLGGERLSGLGSGGDIVRARLAAEDSIAALEPHLTGVRLALLVTALGGGTGGGATLEIVKRLALAGIPTIVFATLPFSFEGDERQRNARGILSMIEDAANASFFLPLDKLVGDTDNMAEAFRRAIDTVSSGLTLFWRLIEKPGYIRLDLERIRQLIQGAGRGRFATVTCQGPARAEEAVDALVRSELLATANGPVRVALCGVLAGDDLRLSELNTISTGLLQAFGTSLTFNLGTVNDEATFSGRLSVVVVLFEGRRTEESPAATRKGRARDRNPLAIGPNGRGRFNNAERTQWHGEDVDVPTFLRENITLEM